MSLAALRTRAEKLLADRRASADRAAVIERSMPPLERHTRIASMAARASESGRCARVAELMALAQQRRDFADLA